MKKVESYSYAVIVKSKYEEKKRKVVKKVLSLENFTFLHNVVQYNYLCVQELNYA